MTSLRTSAAIHHPLDRDGDRRCGKLLFAGDHLNQLHAAGGNRGEEELDGGNRFAGAAVLHRPVDDEVMIARTAEDSAEDIRRSRSDCVLPNLGGLHVSNVQKNLLPNH
ncbi:MAG TPA: hypothetical protein VFL80_13695 [Thermoanaerobaculia bacterium]|nr:hypothetical protein [Thermoanaerobaculia bacterium]